MKKLLSILLSLAIFSAFFAPPASAAGGDMVKVGLRSGSSAMLSANLENEIGRGYEFGWFDRERSFVSIGETGETTISMTAAGDIYMNQNGTYSTEMPSGVHRFLGGWHIELTGYRDFEEASMDAESYGGWPAWINQEYVVRIGSYNSRTEAEDALYKLDIKGGDLVRSSNTGILVTTTKTADILFEFDCGGKLALGILPKERRGEPTTWFKGYRYQGSFEYVRAPGKKLSVINVVDLEDYVKGVIPYEMSGSWPMAALEAQAVCARSFAKGCIRHASEGFDVCNSTHCQVYNGVNSSTDTSDKAVENTAGECLYYHGDMVRDAVYHSSNGGATEDAENVWGGNKGYLKGKKDPYEAQTNIPGYNWSVTYTASELSWILNQKGYSVGQVQNVYVSQYTPVGNVQEVTFEGSGGTARVTGDRCRTIFYSSTYNKSVRSLRFNISGGNDSGHQTSGGIYVNGSEKPLNSLDGVSAISGKGTISKISGNQISAVSSSGISTVSGNTENGRAASTSGDVYTITGSGNGHQVGMSQYGAKAMAELGYNYREILEFYYTDVTIE